MSYFPPTRQYSGPVHPDLVSHGEHPYNQHAPPMPPQQPSFQANTPLLSPQAQYQTPIPAYPPSPAPIPYNSPQPQLHQAYPMSPGGLPTSFSGHFPTPQTPYGFGGGGPPSMYPGSYYPQTSQYAEAHQRLMKKRSVRQIKLTNGHLVMEVPVPRSIMQYNSYKGEDMSRESGKMRYTAVTDDPNDFVAQGYQLRQKLYGRQTELMICMTMYNEDEVLFCRTFTSVIKNIQHLQQREKSKTWGAQSWKKIVVCIVSDGRLKINPRTLKVLGLYGAYQEGLAKDTVDGKDVQGHVYEYTTQVVVDAQGNVKGGIAPVQVLFCLKEKNAKKLNSHRWCFNAFAKQLQPNICILLDVGTKPSGTSLYHLWKEFDKHANVGGACGEITVDLGRGCSNLINPLVAAQNFEYKMSNILDKPLESVFGFISVLPGAFSAYKYKALLGAPLDAYFLGEKMHDGSGAPATLSESNMYLAEDRILCFEIVTKKNARWILRYCKAAKASTDVPAALAEFISQRRRWSNGAFFASLYSTLHYYRVLTSGHGFLRKIWLSIIFLYTLIQMIFQVIGPSSFYLAFVFLVQSATASDTSDPFGGYGDDVLSVCSSLYIATLGITVVCALGNKPAASRWWYMFVVVVFAALFCIEFYCAGYTIWLAVPKTVAGWEDVDALMSNSVFVDIVISLAATYGLYLVGSILYLEPWHMLTSFIQYMLFLPAFANVLPIYSFSNLHDLAWGTKGDTSVKNLGGAKKAGDGKDEVEVKIPTAPEDVDALWLEMKKDVGTPYVEKHVKRDVHTKQADHYANVRTNTLLCYLGLNMVLVIFFTSSYWTNLTAAKASAGSTNSNLYMVVIFWSVAGLAAVRFFGCTMYLVLRLVGW